MNPLFFNKITKSSLRVPRYTSYPTAPNFSKDINSDTYKLWLTKIIKKSNISLYIHIPFCKKLCWYCGCNMQVTNKGNKVSLYVETIIKELDIILKYLDNSCNVTHIHFGGGSPTIINPEDFLKLVNCIKKRLNISESTEINIEIDPRNISEEKIAAYFEAGIRRASLGVQCFDPEVQKAINRVQPFSIVENTFNLLRKHNITNINSDLIYGLPYQNTEKLLKTIDRVSELNSSRVSLFGYAHVPWIKKHQTLIPEEVIPKTQERIEMAIESQKHLQNKEYLPIGLDHFAKKEDSMFSAMKNKKLQRNFQGYTTDQEEILIGIGNSSIGMLPDGYVQNSTSVKDYAESINKGELTTVKGLSFSKDDKIRKEIIFSLMCYLQVDLNQIFSKHNLKQNYFNDELLSLQKFISEGAIQIQDNIITINEKARIAIRVIASVFDKYLVKSEAKHSVSI